MEAFGEDYTVRNRPLLILSGLDSRDRSPSDTTPAQQTFLHDGGFRVRTDLSPLDTPTAHTLREALLGQDGSQTPWRTLSPSSNAAKLFTVKTVGRVGQTPLPPGAMTARLTSRQTFTLPPRKAPPPPHSPRLSAHESSDGPPPPLVLHSPLSPLTPSSPLYPDGIITPLWIAKHQNQLPSALLVFFTLAADPNTSSLLDNKVRHEINAIRGVLSSTNYKCRLVVVLLADGPLDFSDIEDRLSNIRKAANLTDSKSLYFLPSEASTDEINDFAESVLSSLQQPCVEYYRDLSKHARRKRSRSITPQPTTPPSTGHPLPSHGWNARYEFKLGVFAEFRQEMDAACRNYESAYESLFVPEMIDAIAEWSPRFNEARSLSDVIAIRILRCLLWTGQTTSAVRTWSNHRDRVQDLINRRGKGTDNYGWEAWQSTWAKTMADLLSRSDQPTLNVKLPHTPDIVSIFAGPEKSLPVGERLAPWENLQHNGYWLELAQNHTQRRREWAQQIPAEDRNPPGQSPASAIASTAQTYDTYLTLEPHDEVPVDGLGGFNYITDIVSTLESAEKYYAERGQVRMCELTGLKKALEYLQAGTWTEAALLLQPLWKSQLWRQAGWWKLLQHVGWALLDCATRLQDSEMILRLKWELANSIFTSRPDTSFDMRTALDTVPPSDTRLSISLDVEQGAARIISSFAFASAEGYVGEPLDCQFVLHSTARVETRPLRLTEAKLVFEGGLKPIYVGAKEVENTGREIEIESLTLEETSRIPKSSNKRSSARAIASLSGEGNLTLAPGQTRVCNLQVIPREAGEVSVASITIMIEEDRFSLTVTNSDLSGTCEQWWEIKGGVPFPRYVGPSKQVSKAQILPKPPKVEIRVRDFCQAYYINEEIQLDLEISNNEEESVSATVEARLISPIKDAGEMRWLDTAARESNGIAEDTLQTLPSKELSTIPASSADTVCLIISNTSAALNHELEVAVSYTLESDRETVLRKVLTLDVTVARPFEANYDFTPKLDTGPWPSFFDPPTPTDLSQSPIPQGLTQNFLVTANLVSFATGPIVIAGILLTSKNVTGRAVCSTGTGMLKQSEPNSGTPEDISTTISPEQSRNFDFSLSVQKLVLGDRHPVSLDLALEIGWRRPTSDRINTTILEVPRFVVPMAEPRVLLTAEKKPSVGTEGLKLDTYLFKYLIENPSMHFLTFNLNMESSEDFAFSGPKGCAVSLVPISRREVNYKILSRKVIEQGRKSGRDTWVKVQLNVVDAYFNQTLKVQPAVDEDGGEERVKIDKKAGIMLLMD